ncbi:superoxide dismutase family protein [Nocardia vinacea]|uniref:superoxide dismutase family protein n=1 Tax=Nocardia vinacea TaxID=96468 RepID=UPI003AF30353
MRAPRGVGSAQQLAPQGSWFRGRRREAGRATGGTSRRSRDGIAAINYEDSQVTLFGPDSVIGRSIVVSKDKDDYGRGGYSDSRSTATPDAQSRAESSSLWDRRA